MNNRRKLVIALGAGALATPLAALAQQEKRVRRIGFFYGVIIRLGTIYLIDA